MAPVTKITREKEWQEYLKNGFVTDTSPQVEEPETVSDEFILPNVRDLLGCFCEQTGAQFG